MAADQVLVLWHLQIQEQIVALEVQVQKKQPLDEEQQERQERIQNQQQTTQEFFLKKEGLQLQVQTGLLLLQEVHKLHQTEAYNLPQTEVLKEIVPKTIHVRQRIQQIRKAELIQDQVAHEAALIQIRVWLVAAQAEPVLQLIIHNRNQLQVTIKPIAQVLPIIEVQVVEAHQEAIELLLQQSRVVAVTKVLHQEAAEVAAVTGVAVAVAEAVVLQEVQEV